MNLSRVSGSVDGGLFTVRIHYPDCLAKDMLFYAKDCPVPRGGGVIIFNPGEGAAEFIVIFQADLNVWGNSTYLATSGFG